MERLSLESKSARKKSAEMIPALLTLAQSTLIEGLTAASHFWNTKVKLFLVTEIFSEMSFVILKLVRMNLFSSAESLLKRKRIDFSSSNFWQRS